MKPFPQSINNATKHPRPRNNQVARPQGRTHATRVGGSLEVRAALAAGSALLAKLGRFAGIIAEAGKWLSAATVVLVVLKTAADTSCESRAVAFGLKYLKRTSSQRSTNRESMHTKLSMYIHPPGISGANMNTAWMRRLVFTHQQIAPLHAMPATPQQFCIPVVSVFGLQSNIAVKQYGRLRHQKAYSASAHLFI